jgi:hypothetical protein
MQDGVCQIPAPLPETRLTAPDRALAPPARRVVLLGASNLAFAFGPVLGAARRVWGGPLDVLAACGAGRSYGLPRGTPWDKRPGIVACGLWPALEKRPPAPTAALVTDVGNDLAYEAPVAEIAGWVAACVDRLLRAGARVVLTALPLASVGRMSALTFLLMRSVLFPGCRLGRAALLQRTRELDERLRRLAGERGVLLAEPRPAWFGLDPIHIRRRWHAAAYHEILSRWSPAAPPTGPARGSPGRWWYLLRLAPERRWLFGRERFRQQPAGVLADGTTLSFY